MGAVRQLAWAVAFTAIVGYGCASPESLTGSSSSAGGAGAGASAGGTGNAGRDGTGNPGGTGNAGAGGTGNTGPGGPGGMGGTGVAGTAAGGSGATAGSTGGAGTGGSGNAGAAGNGGTAGTSAGGSGGTSADCPTVPGIPDLCGPAASGTPCTEIGFGGFDCPSGQTCRIAGTTARCEPHNVVGNGPCAKNDDCIQAYQCYQNQCMWLCELGSGFGCSGPCMNIGHPTHGVCVD